MAFIVTASFSRDGQTLDCSQAEVLGDAAGVRYATREEAQEAADELAEDLEDTDLDPSTSYDVVEVEGPALAEGDRVEGGKPGTEDYDTGKVLELRGDRVCIGWDSGVKTWETPKGLRII